MRTATHTTTASTGTIPMLVVVYGPSLLALPSDIVRGILEPDQAGAGQTIHAYGLTYPTTDLARHLGLWRPSAPSEPRVILCERQGLRRAVHVDQVRGLTEVPQHGVRPLPPQFSGIERDWFAGLFEVEGRVALLVNPIWLLRSEPVVTALEDQRTPEHDATAHVRPLRGRVEPARGQENDIVDLRRAGDREDAPWRHS